MTVTAHWPHKSRECLCGLESDYFAYVSLTREILNRLFVGMMPVFTYFTSIFRKMNTDRLSIRMGTG